MLTKDIYVKNLEKVISGISMCILQTRKKYKGTIPKELNFEG